jgi:hypothetical protein
METILSWILGAVALAVSLFAVWLLYQILLPILNTYRTRMQSGNLMTLSDLKDTLITVGTISGMILLVPFILLTVFLASLQLTIPVMHDITDELSNYLLGIVNTVADDDAKVYVQPDGTYSTEPPAIDPPVVVIPDISQPAPTPYIWPTPEVIIITPTPVVKTLIPEGGTP